MTSHSELMKGVRNGDYGRVAAALHAGANPARDCAHALAVAAEKGYDRIVALLLPRLSVTDIELSDAGMIAEDNHHPAVAEMIWDRLRRETSRKRPLEDETIDNDYE